ncbi:MAG: hypothetical protein CM1200mP22_24390 [Dehalococcoidia bacterium]|nr:MAG: hypothetical protein CM1200mP22_24390 [Dehalococcoidia bacterium]
MKNIGIIYNARVPEALDLSTAILHDLNLSEASWLAPAENRENLQSKSENTDLVITVGGDGTILRATTFTGPAGIPWLESTWAVLDSCPNSRWMRPWRSCRFILTVVLGGRT